MHIRELKWFLVALLSKSQSVGSLREEPCGTICSASGTIDTRFPANTTRSLFKLHESFTVEGTNGLVLLT